MKADTKKLIVIIAALVLTVAMATTTTFAWFAMRDTVSLNDMDFTIDAEEGLLISMDNVAYRMTVDANWTDKVIDAVTPKLTDGIWTPGFNFQDVAGTTVGAISDGNGTTSKPWMCQSIYFRSDKAMSVSLIGLTIGGTNGTRTVYVPNTVAADTYGTGSPAIAANGTVNTDAKYAARVAIFNGDGTTLLGIYRYENGTWSTLSASNMNFAADLYNMYTAPLLTPTDLVEAKKADNSSAVALASSITEVNPLSNVATTVLQTSTVENPIPAGTAYYASIKIVVWLEGKDGNCTNACIGDTITVALNFKGIEA